MIEMWAFTQAETPYIRQVQLTATWPNPKICHLGFAKCCDKVELLIVNTVYQTLHNHTSLAFSSGR